MNKLTPLIIFSLLIGCSKAPDLNKFSSQSDTLVITSNRIKGNGLFPVSAGSAHFFDTNNLEQLKEFDYYPDYQINYPKGITDLELGFFSLMFDSLKYYHSTKDIDGVQQNFSLYDRQLLMVKGLKDSVEVIIVDANNNKDFTDDSIDTIPIWSWKPNENLIKITYNVKIKNNTITDSGWIKIGHYNDRILLSSCQHQLAKFTIDDENFTIGIIDENAGSFCFNKPVLYPYGEDGIERDTFLFSDLVNVGEYIKLGNTHYKFHELYNGCGTAVLIKEENFNALIGTQIGMIAPLFECVSINGDTISSHDLVKAKSLLIANVSGCTARSYGVYNKLVHSCSDSLAIIALDSGIEEGLVGIVANVENKFNNSVYQNYRNAYSSYDCFLIDTNGRLIDKFDIFNWEANLAKYSNESEI